MENQTLEREDMEFIGEFYFNMDAKGRVTLPARFREGLGDGFYVTKGYEGCLGVYDKQQWAKFSTELKALPETSRAVRFAQRSFLSGADRPEPDKQGKILLSAAHRRYAGLVKEVAIVGVGGHIEIWDRQRWEDYNSGDIMTLEQAGEELEKLR